MNVLHLLMKCCRKLINFMSNFNRMKRFTAAHFLLVVVSLFVATAD